MNLVIDIGNTRIKAAVFNNSHLMDMIRVDHTEKKELLRFLKKHNPTSAIVSSVKEKKYNLKKEFDTLGLDPLYLSMSTELPINIDYSVDTLGLDRIADAMAAYSFSKKKNKLIIDCGTCITYNYIIENNFVGGAISPGMLMRYKALNHYTGRLPLLSDRARVEIIENSTVGSIKSGVINGMIMEIQGLCDSFLSDYSDTEIFITGGDSIFFAEGLKNSIFADPNLTLKGLNEILIFNEK